MNAVISFSDILASFSRAWRSRNTDQCILSFALPIQGLDPLSDLPILAKDQSFRFLWDLSSTDSFAASGQCEYLELNGAKRFELAQKFNDATFERLLDASPEAPKEANARILYSFSFFENLSERYHEKRIPPVLQAVLPRFQLTRHGQICWLRINGEVTNAADGRELAEKICLLAKQLSDHCDAVKNFISLPEILGISVGQSWETSYQPVLRKGIDLVNNGELEKIVLAVRQSILLQEPLDPLSILFKLRDQQKGTCRFLWQNNQNDCFFGASPERLLSFKDNYLFTDALAGTCISSIEARYNLFQSEKDRREHQFVVSTIVEKLLSQGFKPRYLLDPKLSRFGNICHLHTPISSRVNHQKPILVLNALHPTPAVAGLPLKQAVNWIRTLEPFERGRYASPIGWVSSSGESEFRVAIRCGSTNGKYLNLIAGAGLVKGSEEESEMEEVALKLGVLADQFRLITN